MNASRATPRGLRALYVCYLGLDDPLVHTQVVAYLAGLSDCGHVIHLLTFEPGRLSRKRRRRLREQMASCGITWHGLRYHKHPSLLATAHDVISGALTAAYLMRRHRLDVLHARSHVPAAMALITSLLAPLRFLFDIRGLMAEEYLDAGNWRPGSLPFRLTKFVERAAIRRADAAVVLTERARRLLFADADPRVVVIPCCVDVTQSTRRTSSRADIRNRLGLGHCTVLIYVGKLGGWYLQREMVHFFARARGTIRDLHFLLLTQSDSSVVVAEFERLQVPDEAHTITRVGPDEVGDYLAVADAAISLIRPCHSKLSSSPTKIGEYLAAGLPIITGPRIGDVDLLLKEYDAGVILDSFDSASFDWGVHRLCERMAESGHAERCRRAATERLSLATVGVPRYHTLYQRLAG